MINKNLLRTGLINKFTNQLMESVVTEAFVRGLPFNKEDMRCEIDSYKNYVGSVLESLGGGYTLLENAVKNTKPGYIHDLAIDIVSTAIEAADRIVKESSEVTDPENSMYSIIDESEFTAEELSRFKKKGSNVSIKDVGKVINKKVIDTIKLEKNEYEDSEDLKEKLSAALDDATDKDDSEKGVSDEPSTADDSGLSEDDLNDPDLNTDDEPKDSEPIENEKSGLESLYRTNLTPFDVVKPISLFSKLQDLCLESVLCTNETYSSLPFKTLTKITLESTLGDFSPKSKSIEEELESLKLASESYRDTESSEDSFRAKMDTAMSCAICIETLLETLNTFKLYKPSLESVREFVDKHVTYASATESDLNAIKNKLTGISKNMLADATDNNSIEDLRNKYSHIESIIESVEGLPPEYDSIKNDVHEAFESTAKFIYDKCVDLNNHYDAVTESIYDIKNREANISEFDKIARTYGKHPNVSEIRIVFDPASENVGAVSINVYGRNSNKLDSTIAVIHGYESYKSFKDCVLEAAQLSKLPYSGKNLNYYDTTTCKLHSLY